MYPNFSSFLARNWWFLLLGLAKACNNSEKSNVTSSPLYDFLFLTGLLLLAMYLYWFFRYGTSLAQYSASYASEDQHQQSRHPIKARRTNPPEAIADYVYDTANSGEFQKVFSNCLKDMGENPHMSKRQKQEILILLSFAMTMAIKRSKNKINNTDGFLNKVHEALFERVSNLPNDKLALETLVSKRYDTYLESLNNDDDKKLMVLAAVFSDYLLNRDVKHEGMALMVTVAGLFISYVENIEALIAEILPN